MMRIPVLVRTGTVLAIQEHTTNPDPFKTSWRVNDRERIILLDHDVLTEILRRASPSDERIDDVIMRTML